MGLSVFTILQNQSFRKIRKEVDVYETWEEMAGLRKWEEVG